MCPDRSDKQRHSTALFLPAEQRWRNGGFAFRHGKMANMLFADGHAAGVDKGTHANNMNSVYGWYNTKTFLAINPDTSVGQISF